MKKKLKKMMGAVLGLIFGAAIGVGCIWTMGLEVLDEAGFVEFMCKYLLIFLAFIITFMVHTILHEGGHCIAGLLSGYQFVSFRVGSLTLAKYEDGFKLKRFSIPGTAGQCLMAPPPYNDGNYPYKLYLASGVLVNVVVSVICIVVGFVLGMDSFIGRFLVLVAIGGIYLALTNGIPMEIGGVANDGKDLFQLEKNEQQRRGLWKGLNFNARQQEGYRVSELLDPEEFLPDEEMTENAHEMGTMMLLSMKLAYLIDTKQYEATYALIEKTLENKKIIDLYKKEYRCEKLFLELMLQCRRAEIENLYDKELKQYVKSTSTYMLSKTRLMYAYHLLYEKDETAAQKDYDKFQKQMKNYPNLGDMKTEQMLLEEVQRLHNARTTKEYETEK